MYFPVHLLCFISQSALCVKRAGHLKIKEKGKDSLKTIAPHGSVACYKSPVKCNSEDAARRIRTHPRAPRYPALKG